MPLTGVGPSIPPAPPGPPPAPAAPVAQSRPVASMGRTSIVPYTSKLLSETRAAAFVPINLTVAPEATVSEPKEKMPTPPIW